jgi:hypothetical protein
MSREIPTLSCMLVSVKRVSYPLLSVVSREIPIYPILFVSVKRDPYALLSVNVKRDPYTLLSVSVKITPSPLPMMDEGLASKSSGLIYQLNPSSPPSPLLTEPCQISISNVLWVQP